MKKNMVFSLVAFWVLAVFCVAFCVVFAAETGEKITTIHAPDGRPYLDVYDEDTMASDSATGVPTQQSVKAYVDTEKSEVDIVALGTMVNGTTETTCYLDDTPDGEWGAEGGTADPTDTADTTIYKVGTKSLKLAWTSAAVDGDGVKANLPAPDDLEANESIGFWFLTDTALAAADLELVITDDGGARTFNFPAVPTINTWTWIEINISSLAAGTGDVCSVAHILLSATGATNLKAFNCYVDYMYKWDADNEEAIGHSVDNGDVIVWAIATAAGTANTQTVLTKNTDYFIHYESGSDFLVTVTDQSAKSAMCFVRY